MRNTRIPRIASGGAKWAKVFIFAQALCREMLAFLSPSSSQRATMKLSKRVNKSLSPSPPFLLSATHGGEVKVSSEVRILSQSLLFPLASWKKVLHVPTRTNIVPSPHWPFPPAVSPPDASSQTHVFIFSLQHFLRVAKNDNGGRGGGDGIFVTGARKEFCFPFLYRDALKGVSVLTSGFLLGYAYFRQHCQK